MAALNIIGKVKFFNRFLRLVQNPTSLEEVIKLNQTVHGMVDAEQIDEMLSAFRSTPQGISALRDRVRVGKTDMPYLASLPPNTLGGAYYSFLNKNSLNPNDLPALDPQNNSSDFDYTRAHLFETHDIWHAVTGFGSDVPGELALQAFYLTQFPARLSLILFSSGFLHQTQLPIESSRLTMEAIVDGYTKGKNARGLLGRDWKKEWERDLSDLRAELGILPAH